MSLLFINFITEHIGAEIQKPKMATTNHFLVTWIPAVHAGMTAYFYGYELVIGSKSQ